MKGIRLAEGHTWEWRSTPAASAEQIHSLRMLYDVIGEHQRTPEPDTWNCDNCPLSEDGTFHVEAIRLKIDNVEPANNEVTIPWIRDIPLKVNTFIWEANL